MEVRGEEAVTLMWNEYQGVKVEICQETVRARHPRHGYDQKKMWDLEQASLLLLADETYLVVCDCGYNGLTGKKPYVKPEGPYKDITKQVDSVMAHKSATHWVKIARGSLYSDAEIKTVISIYLKWKQIGGEDWNQRALDEIDLFGIKSRSGGKVTPSAVRNVLSRYRHQDKFRNVGPAPVSVEARATLDQQIQEAAAKAVRDARFRHSVATEARITQTKRGIKRRTPIDFDKIVQQHEADKAFRERLAPEKAPELTQETTVPSTLSFGSPIESAAPVQKLVRQTVVPVDKPVIVPTPRVPEVVFEKSDFELVAEIEEGVPLFRYKGGPLMVGKKAKIQVEA